MGNVFATHTASDEDTIIYLKSKDTGKFWHSNSREGEGFKFSKTKNTSTAWIIEWNSGDISVGSIINLKSVANGGYLHSNMDEDEDEGVSWGERDADYAWTIYFGYDDAAAAPRSAAPNQRAVDALAHSTGSLLMLFTDFASKEFLPWSEANHSPSHNKLQASIVHVHLSPYFKGRHLDEITPTLVEDYVTQRRRGRHRTGRKTKP